MENLIEIGDAGQLENWARRLAVSPDRLLLLVEQVGPELRRIRSALKQEEICRTGGRRVPEH